MLLTSICAVLASIVFCDMAASAAAPRLSASVTGPKAVDGIDKLSLIVRVTNNGNETLKLLNDPNSPLSMMPTDSFSIVNEKGARPAFVGIRVKYSPAYVVRLHDDSFFTVLGPGQSVNITHDLSKAYNFTNTGEGKYSFEANNLFYYVDPTSQVARSLVASTEPHHASLTGTLAVAHPGSTLRKRATFIGCTLDQQSLLITAANDAYSYANEAMLYLGNNPGPTPRYTTWFGAFTPNRYNTVLSVFVNVALHTFSSYTFDCTLSGCDSPTTIAFSRPPIYGTVSLCAAFWQAPATGLESKAGTILHESTHFLANGGTADHAYHAADDKLLAMTDPDKAVMNADSYELFGENYPALP